MVGLLLTSEEVNINGENYERVLLWDSVIDDPRSQDSEEDWLPTVSIVVPGVESDSANLFASECTDGLHRLAIDVDCADIGIDINKVLEYLERAFPECITNLRYWESTTSGNYHVIADSPMIWSNHYEWLLNRLESKGYIQEGYYNASLARQRTQLRLPHIKKLLGGYNA